MNSKTKNFWRCGILACFTFTIGMACADNAPKTEVVSLLVSIAKTDRGQSSLYFPSMAQRLNAPVANIIESEKVMREFIRNRHLPNLATTKCVHVDGMYYIASDAFVVYSFANISEIRYFTPK